MSRIEQEKKTIKAMVGIYCRFKEHNHFLCNDCRQLLDYAFKRLEHCKFGNDKGSCRKCPIHCYKSDMREKMREVMRFSGPKMIIFHPIMAIKHLLVERK